MTIITSAVAFGMAMGEFDRNASRHFSIHNSKTAPLDVRGLHHKHIATIAPGETVEFDIKQSDMWGDRVFTDQRDPKGFTVGSSAEYAYINPSSEVSSRLFDLSNFPFLAYPVRLSNAAKKRFGESTKHVRLTLEELLREQSEFLRKVSDLQHEAREQLKAKATA